MREVMVMLPPALYLETKQKIDRNFWVQKAEHEVEIPRIFELSSCEDVRVALGKWMSERAISWFMHVKASLDSDVNKVFAKEELARKASELKQWKLRMLFLDARNLMEQWEQHMAVHECNLMVVPRVFAHDTLPPMSLHCDGDGSGGTGVSQAPQLHHLFLGLGAGSGGSGGTGVSQAPQRPLVQPPQQLGNSQPEPEAVGPAGHLEPQQAVTSGELSSQSSLGPQLAVTSAESLPSLSRMPLGGLAPESLPSLSRMPPRVEGSQQDLEMQPVEDSQPVEDLLHTSQPLVSEAPDQIVGSMSGLAAAMAGAASAATSYVRSSLAPSSLQLASPTSMPCESNVSSSEIVVQEIVVLDDSDEDNQTGGGVPVAPVAPAHAGEFCESCGVLAAPPHAGESSGGVTGGPRGGDGGADFAEESQTQMVPFPDVDAMLETQAYDDAPTPRLSSVSALSHLASVNRFTDPMAYANAIKNAFHEESCQARTRSRSRRNRPIARPLANRSAA